MLPGLEFGISLQIKKLSEHESLGCVVFEVK